ncbi:MAG: NTP transferase domain-containing protein [Candidatus Methanodesulfokora sp.]
MPRTAVILAAGMASRLEPYSSDAPKCLFELSPGVTILGFIISQLKEVGVERIIVVTRPEFAGMMERYEVEIRINKERGSGNLYSFLVGAEGIEEDFILLMSDHIFELEVLRRLLRGRRDRGFTLCLDRNPGWERVREGLRVVVKDGKIVDAGKESSPRCGVDTGLFYCSKGSVEMAKEVVNKRGVQASISDLLKLAIERGDAGYVDVTGLLWVDIDTPEDLEEARALYPRILRKSLRKPEDGPISALINRPISTRISTYLYRKGIYISPNLMSFISFLTCILGSLLFLLGFNVLSGLLIQLSSILDGVDGEIARLFGTKSKFGALLDSILDRYADLAVVISAALAIKMDPLMLFIALLSAANVFTVSYVSRLSRTSIRKYSFSTRDVRLLVAAVAMIAGAPWAFLYYMALFPTVFSAAVLLTFERESLVPAKRERRKPLPEVEVKKQSEAMRNITTILLSSFKLVILVLAIRGISWLMKGVEIIELSGYIVRASDVLSLVEIIVIVYFGYRIIMASKFFVDRASERLVERLGATHTAVRRILLDLVYASFFAVMLLEIPHRIASVPAVGGALEKAIAFAILMIMALILYDLMKTFYRSLKGIIEEFAERV